MKYIKWIALFSLSFVFGCASNSNTSVVSVDDMSKVNNYDGLVSYYKSELEKSPNNKDLTHNLAVAYFDKGDVESARFYSDHLINQGYRDAEMFELRGQIYHIDGKDELATEYYRKSMELGNDSAKVEVLLGVSYCMLRRYPLAENAFNRARLKGYSDLAIKNNLAMIRFAEQDYDEAANMLLSLYSQYPSNKKVKTNLALSLIKLGEYEQVRTLLDSDYSDEEIDEISIRLTSI